MVIIFIVGPQVHGAIEIVVIFICLCNKKNLVKLPD